MPYQPDSLTVGSRQPVAIIAIFTIDFFCSEVAAGCLVAG